MAPSPPPEAPPPEVEVQVEELEGVVTVSAHLPGLSRPQDASLDISARRLRLRAPGFRALDLDFASPVDLALAAARWQRRGERLIVRAPLAAAHLGGEGGEASREVSDAGLGGGRPSFSDGTSLAREVEGSGGVLAISKPGVFDPSHSSSQAMLEWLRTVAGPRGWLERADVLDYGCGSGTLGLCALRLGARSVTAVDLDRRALASARANAELNGLADRFRVCLPPEEGRERDFDDFFGDFEEEWRGEAAENARGGGDVPPLSAAEGARFCCVLANMRKNALLRCAPRLVDLCEPGGVVAVSGFMMDFEERAVVGAFRAAGLQCDVVLDAPSPTMMGDIIVNGGYGLFWGMRV